MQAQTPGPQMSIHRTLLGTAVITLTNQGALMVCRVHADLMHAATVGLNLN